MNLFKRETKRGFIGFLIWAITLAAIVIFAMSAYPSVAKNSTSMNQFMKSLPPSMTKAFNLDKLNYADILGYYSTEIGTFIILCGSMYAMILGSSMISKEIDDRTIEFLQSKPITRTSILTQKLTSGILYIILLNIFLFFTSYFSFEKVKTSSYSIKKLFLIFAGYLIIELTFVSLGLLLSLVIKKKKISTGLSLWTVLGMYLLYVLSGISDNLKVLKNFAAFKYADAADIIINGKYKASYLLVLAIVIVISIVLSYILYRRKDISA